MCVFSNINIEVYIIFTKIKLKKTILTILHNNRNENSCHKYHKKTLALASHFGKSASIEASSTPHPPLKAAKLSIFHSTFLVWATWLVCWSFVAATFSLLVPLLHFWFWSRHPYSFNVCPSLLITSSHK